MDEILGSRTVSSDFVEMFLGKKIGGGQFRNVYECSNDKTVVIKVESGIRDFQNISEWNFWESVQYNKKIARWLAPCIKISNCGTVIIQKKTTPLRPSEVPKQLPEFIRDVKVENLGMLDGKVVCIDYGSVNITTSTKLVKADY